ncbi:MAG: NAD(P)H-dependent oxidoreductase subunit E [Desulfarculaceae bacterium]|nr:NAD(P)H-dependent oxidoreductase subunit E [Desulfarculaceae bacterium]MCF8073013.1 NAD(P)H-dependent oxidoreductase subunit E [Desulfarculaceae bacterium]MCF8101902.1 NAD(P)H-dependent oxidoreductase subunit E [Desulfarculaceae bacterium]MCF8115429.1 NAD(P)H-dependent oxidoreductase subunit E [Desulfarculaceae bacterium]
MAQTAIDIDIDEIIERYPGKPEYLIFLMQDIQAAFNYISPEALTLVCDHTGVAESQAYAVATFYNSFSLEPKGENLVQVCLGTACHLKGSGLIAENLMRSIGLDEPGTTEDLKYTVETVNCLGACALAPVAVVNEAYQPKVSSPKLMKTVKKLGDA